MSNPLNSRQLDEKAVAQQGGFIDRQVHAARARMHQAFLTAIAPSSETTILDVGASADPALDASNYLEWASPDLKITAFGLGESNPRWTKLYPGIPYVHGSALNLPFAGDSFDVVYSHAVIEHVGSFENQCRMLAEALRVARHGLWITTPDRFHPMEFHTALPILHWLPKALHRGLLRRIGFRDFATEDALNLLNRRSFRDALGAAVERTPNKTVQVAIHRSTFWGVSANLLMQVTCASKP